MLAKPTNILYYAAMKRPAVHLENAKQVYDYYDQRDPHRLNTFVLHKLFGTLYRPRVTFAAGSAEVSQNHLEKGGQMILAANHTRLEDPLILASLAERVKPLHGLRANTIVLAKPDVFKIPFVRPFLDNFVAEPVFRTKDRLRSNLAPEAALEQHSYATRRMTELCIRRAGLGNNIALFPTGERGSDKTMKGIGHIACGLTEPDNFLILPIGIDYTRSSKGMRPDVYIGIPIKLPSTVEEVVTQVDQAIQDCVVSARAV